MWHTAREKKSGRRRGEMGLNNTEDETKFLLECCPIFSQWCLSFSSKLLNVMETCPFCYLIPYPFVCYTHSSVLVGLGGVKKKKNRECIYMKSPGVKILQWRYLKTGLINSLESEFAARVDSEKFPHHLPNSQSILDSTQVAYFSLNGALISFISDAEDWVNSVDIWALGPFHWMVCS